MCLPEDDYGDGLYFEDDFVYENPDYDYEYEYDYDYDYESDYDYFDDYDFFEDDDDIYYTVLYLLDSSMVQDIVWLAKLVRLCVYLEI